MKMRFPLFCALLVACFTPVLAARAEDVATEVVEVDGVGATADAAMKNAVKRAVQAVVGSIVDERTAVANEQLIRDQVLTYSDGFLLNDLEVIRAPTPDPSIGGLMKCRVRAVVRRDAVAAKVKALPLVTAAVSGAQMAAEATAAASTALSGRALLEAVRDRAPPHRLLAARLVDSKGQPVGPQGIERKVDVDRGETKLALHIEVFEDPEAYAREFAAPLIAALDKVATLEDPHVALAPALKGDLAVIEQGHLAPSKGRLGANVGKEVLVLVHRAQDVYSGNPGCRKFERVSEISAACAAPRMVLRAYSVADELRDSLPPHVPRVASSATLAGRLALRLALLTASGRVVVDHRVSLSHGSDGVRYDAGIGFQQRGGSGGESCLTVSKRHPRERGELYCRSIIVDTDITLSNEELEKVSQVALEVLP
jgi:hypothetical protein